MDTKFWIEKWESNDIAFHRAGANPLLVQHFEKLPIRPGARIFIPLCGKTRDIAWLLEGGYRVAGAELSELAITQLFAELGVKPKISNAGTFKHFSAENLDIFVGDIFQLSQETLGSVDAVYDRAALVALPGEMRPRYAAHIVTITRGAPQLVISYEYDQSVLAGPPFSINREEMSRYYRNYHDAALIETLEVSGGLKGKCPAKEHVWLIK